MQYNVNEVLSEGMTGEVEDIVRNVTAGISGSIEQKYGIMDLAKVPDHVTYAKVQKYLRSIGVEITRKIFNVYLNSGLLPGGHEVKNRKLIFYTREQIIHFILIDMFKPILPLSKVKVLFDEILSPIIADIGLDEAFTMMCEIIVYMTGKFEDAISTAVADAKLRIAIIPPEISENTLKSLYDIGHFTNIVSLCIARGALDFYKFSPYALLE